MDASLTPGFAELLLLGLVGSLTLISIALLAGLVAWIVNRPGRLRQEEMHRKELKILDEVRQGLERMDRRVVAIEELLPRNLERKEAEQ
jgi:hypothetical protein